VPYALNKEINTAMTDPKLKARLGELGGTILARSPADFAKQIADDTERWGKVITAANIKASAKTNDKSKASEGVRLPGTWTGGSLTVGFGGDMCVADC